MPRIDPKASVVAQLGDAWKERRDIKTVKIISAFGKSQVIKPLSCLSFLCVNISLRDRQTLATFREISALLSQGQ